MSKYKLPNGLIVNLDDETGATTVVGGGGRTVAPGARVTDEGILGAAPTGAEPRAISRPSDQQKPAPSDEEIEHPDAPLAAQTPPTETNDAGQPRAPGLIKEDPIGTVITGAGAAKAGAALARAAGGGVLGAAIEGAHVAGIPTLVETGDPKQAARAAIAGAGVGTVANTIPALPSAIGNAARSRNIERLPTAVTGGATSKAAKAVVGARDILRETAQAFPELQGPLLSGDRSIQADAIGSKLNMLENENDVATKAIGQSHPRAVGGRVPADTVIDKLEALHDAAHAGEGGSTLKKAARQTIDEIKSFVDETGTISPDQLRQVRNDLAVNIGGDIPRGSPAADRAFSNATRVKATLNDAIADLAKDAGVSDTALRERNKQIASLLPAQRFLEQQTEIEAGKPPGVLPAAVHAIVHPKETAVHAAAALPSVIDQHLAKLAGPAGQAGVQALKAVALSPTRETLQAAVRAGVTPQIALQVARLGAAQLQPAGAQ